jgi:hypothetical protein
MTLTACQIAGGWRTIEAYLRGRGFLTPLQPAITTIGLHSSEAGSAERRHNGSPDISFVSHHGDEETLATVQTTSSTAC